MLRWPRACPRLTAAVPVLLCAPALHGCETPFAYGYLHADAGGERDGSFDTCQRPGTPKLTELSCRVTRAEYGLCSCGDIQNSASLELDAYDSAHAAYLPGDSGGSLGTLGSFYPAVARIGGALTVAGPNGAPLSGDLQVAGDMRCAGQVDGPVAVMVGGDLEALGSVHVQKLEVGGAFRVGESSDVRVVAGTPAFTRDARAPKPPCACEPLLDVTARIAAARVEHDNARIGLDPQTGLKALDGPLERTLPCGRYYVNELYAAHPITLTIAGAVELHVDSSVVADAAGTLDIQLAPGGELDLFVRGGMATQNRVEIGSRAAPGRTRIYAQADSGLYFGGDTTLSALLYAPAAGLVTEANFEAFGALLVGSASSSAPVRVHFDRALAHCPDEN